MLTKKEILELVEEMEIESKKRIYRPVFYKYKGEMRRRSYDEIVDTPRYEKLLHFLYEDEKGRIFKCEDCGKMCTYGDLESWICDFKNDEYICSCCYEDAMGEDL